MTPVERLRQDHAVIRAKLSLLENALTVGPDAAFAIRELVYSLSRRLADHEAREDAQLYPVLHETLAEAQDTFARSLAMEHEGHETLLRELHVLTLTGARMPMIRVAQLAHELMASLSDHMDREERLLFPALERLTVGREANARARTATEGGAMPAPVTINRILGEYPEAKRVFECHCIDCRREGEDFLDEVAWRHAVPLHELLNELHQAARQPRREDGDAETLIYG